MSGRAQTIASAHVTAVASIFHDERMELLKTVGERVTPDGQLVNVIHAVIEPQDAGESFSRDAVRLRLSHRELNGDRRAIIYEVSQSMLERELMDPAGCAESLKVVLHEQPALHDGEEAIIVHASRGKIA